MASITDVRAFQPATPGSPADWRTSLGQIVVLVTADSGLTGIGVGGGGAAGVHIVETVLRDLLLGRDAEPVEELQAEMIEHTSFYGRKGIVVMAISGVDLALWDLRGRAAGLPVARLLRDDVDLATPLPTYSTVAEIDAVKQALDDGNSAIKLHVERFGDQVPVTRLAGFVKEVRDLAGDTTSVMIDAFARWDVDTTLRVADAVAPLGVEWIEEPLAPDDLQGYADLAQRCPVPIAGGEHEYTRSGFHELIDRKLHAVLQPDINWCGGLTTVVDVYRMAKSAGLRVCLHRGSEPYGLHAIAALDPQPLAESPRPWFNCLLGAATIRQGEIVVPDRPGFGIDVDLP